jgi:hypothetical protein
MKEYGEDQRCGLTMKNKKVRWHSLQVKLRKMMYVRVQDEELRFGNEEFVFSKITFIQG